MNCKFAIISYKRHTSINEKTISTLQRHGVPYGNMYVFVVQDEFQLYRDVLPKDVVVVVGKLGVIQQRQCVVDYFQENEHIVCCDDDLNDIDFSLSQFTNLNEFITTGFSDCAKYNAYIFGIYPVRNPFFMKKRPHLQTGLSFIAGYLYGIIIRKSDDLRITTVQHLKEYVELSIRHFIKDGCVLRYDRVCGKTTLFSKGGLGNKEGRIIPGNDDADRLHFKFPRYTSVKIRNDGRKEIVFQKRPRIAPEDCVNQLPRISSDMFDKLFELLSVKQLKLHKVEFRNNGTVIKPRNGFDEHRASCLGLSQNYSTQVVDLSAFSKQNPQIHDEIFRIGKLVCPFEFTSVQLNHNVVCPPHIDGGNTGLSCIVSFGTYEGCRLVVGGKEYDAQYAPMTFNGSSIEHYNTPLLSGNKYSIVYYNDAKCTSLVDPRILPKLDDPVTRGLEQNADDLSSNFICEHDELGNKSYTLKNITLIHKNPLRIVGDLHIPFGIELYVYNSLTVTGTVYCNGNMFVRPVSYKSTEVAPTFNGHVSRTSTGHVYFAGGSIINDDVKRESSRIDSQDI